MVMTCIVEPPSIYQW